MNGRTVLVTGGAGFIGSHLVDALVSAGARDVIVVDDLFLGEKDNLKSAEAKGQIHFYQENAGDLKRMREIARAHEVAILYDLATIPLPASLERPAWSSNIIWDIAVVAAELAREGDIERLVHCSSSEVYGSARYTPMDEDHPLNVETPYAAAKAAGDLLIRSYVQTFGIDAVTVRPFNNYGPRQNDKSYAGVIPITIRRILAGEPPIVFGDGDQTRDYIYVADTAEAILKISELGDMRGEALNIATGQEIPIRNLIARICEAMEYTGEWIWKEPRVADVRRHSAGTVRLDQVLAWEPSTSLTEGISQTVDWYRRRYARTR